MGCGASKNAVIPVHIADGESPITSPSTRTSTPSKDESKSLKQFPIDLPKSEPKKSSTSEKKLVIASNKTTPSSVPIATPRGEFTSEEIELVQDTYKVISASTTVSLAFGKLFYDNLFQTHPEMKELFGPDHGEQIRKLFAGISTIVNALHKLTSDKLRIIQMTGARHRHYGVQPEMFADFATVFIRTIDQYIQNISPIAWNLEAKRAWIHFFTFLVHILEDGCLDHKLVDLVASQVAQTKQEASQGQRMPMYRVPSLRSFRTLGPSPLAQALTRKDIVGEDDEEKRDSEPKEISIEVLPKMKDSESRPISQPKPKVVIVEKVHTPFLAQHGESMF